MLDVRLFEPNPGSAPAIKDGARLENISLQPKEQHKQHQGCERRHHRPNGIPAQPARLKQIYNILNLGLRCCVEIERLHPVIDWDVDRNSWKMNTKQEHQAGEN